MMLHTSKSKLYRQRIIFIGCILIMLLLEFKFFDITVLKHSELKNNSHAKSKQFSSESSFEQLIDIARSITS